MHVHEIETVIRDQMHLPVSPELLKPIEAHQARTATIKAERFQPDKEAEALATAHADALAQADAALEQQLATDGELCRLKSDRAKLETLASGESDTLWQARIERFTHRTDAERFAELSRQQEKVNWALLVAARLPGRLAEIGDLAEPGELLDAYEAALETQDGDTIRAVGRAALRRLHREERAAADEPPNSPRRSVWREARRTLSARHDGWTREHPSVTDRRRATDAAIASRERQLRDAHRHALKFAGLL